MLLQALFSRGGSPIHYCIEGITYVFERNDEGDFVCDMNFSAHVLVALQTGNFGVYEPKVVVDDGPTEVEHTADTVPTVEANVKKKGKK